jgi:hypothetical protein
MTVDASQSELFLRRSPYPRRCTLKFQFEEDGTWKDARVWDERIDTVVISQ